ncbi:hypothetical protein [Nocardia sp. NPDC057353]|uniref:hypothetical protein n=1 Tax=Nocardia sp. NPDC057353 TaxID=3346104 RepID=UPI0036346588
MKPLTLSGLYVCEGTSDLPLADIIETLFLEKGVEIRLTKPDFRILAGVPKDVESRITAGLALLGFDPDIIVVHRDADGDGWERRKKEIRTAVNHAAPQIPCVVSVIPVRMTEAWLLLDETAIRRVAGKPSGKASLNLPGPKKIESEPDPKQLLKMCLLEASECTGRRRERVAKRFNEHRRQLLERVGGSEGVKTLPSWQRLLDEVDAVIAGLED